MLCLFLKQSEVWLWKLSPPFGKSYTCPEINRSEWINTDKKHFFYHVAHCQAINIKCIHTPNECCLCLDLPKVVFFCKCVLLAAYFWLPSVCVCLCYRARPCFVLRLSERKMHWVWLALGMFSKQNAGWVVGLFWLALGTESRAQRGEWTQGLQLLEAEIRVSGSNSHWTEVLKRCLVTCSASEILGDARVGAVLALTYRFGHLFSTSTYVLALLDWQL